MTNSRRKRTQTDESSATFAALYRHYVKPIYSYFHRRVGRKADVEDLTEQVFMEALEKFETYQEQGRASAWLFTIAHSRVVDYYRRQRYHLPFNEALDRPDHAPSPEHQLSQREQQERLFALLDNLDADKQELILLRYGAELTYQEIGKIVGKSEAAVKMATYRVLDELRLAWQLAKYGVSEDNND